MNEKKAKQYRRMQRQIVNGYLSDLKFKERYRFAFTKVKLNLGKINPKYYQWARKFFLEIKKNMSRWDKIVFLFRGSYYKALRRANQYVGGARKTPRY